MIKFKVVKQKKKEKAYFLTLRKTVGIHIQISIPRPTGNTALLYLERSPTLILIHFSHRIKSTVRALSWSSLWWIQSLFHQHWLNTCVHWTAVIFFFYFSNDKFLHTLHVESFIWAIIIYSLYILTGRVSFSFCTWSEHVYSPVM